MKALTWIAVLLGMAGGACAAEPVTGQERALCQGNYPVLLMTELECRGYVERRRLLQGQNDTGARIALELQHDRLLSERAAACACAHLRTVSEAPVVVAGDC